MVTIHIDNVSFELKKKQNFLWLKELGNVFCVNDMGGTFGDQKDLNHPKNIF